MRMLHKLQHQLRSIFRPFREERDLEEELRDYVERERAEGWSAEEARRRALAGLNGMERVKEECRDARGTRWVEETLIDLRVGCRTLRKTPVFTVTIIAALAFCIGINTAIFSIVDTALFRPLPFPDQEQLVAVLFRARVGL